MTIQDLEGRSFEITDIEGTLRLLDDFLSQIRKENLHSLKRLEERRLQYWQDFKQKLIALKLS